MRSVVGQQTSPSSHGDCVPVVQTHPSTVQGVGTVVGVTERRVTLKLGDSVRVECLRSAVTGLESDGKTDPDSA